MRPLVRCITAPTILAVAAAALGLAWACSVNLEPMPEDEPCTSVGYSIASRTLACTGDQTLATERFDAFQREFRCNPWSHVVGSSAPFECSRQVNQLWCDRFTTCADDLHCLLREVDECLTLLTPADGEGWHEEQWDAGDAGNPEGGDAGGRIISQMLSSNAHPGAFVQDADALYFSTRSPGSDAGKVSRVPKGGEGSRYLAVGLLCDTDAGPSLGPLGLALDDTHVFVAVEGCETVVRLAKDASETSTIASFPEGVGVAHVAVVGHEVFVAQVSAFKVVAMDKDGNAQRDVASLDPGVRITGLAASATELFWTANGVGPSLQKVPLTGGTPMTLASGHAGASLPVIAGDEVFFVDNQPGGAILRVPQAGGAVSVFAADQQSPVGLSVDATTAVWSRQDPGTVVLLPRGGGAEDVVATAQAGVSFVLMDAQHVYWTKRDPYMKLMRAER